jgi:hypothetical protein
MPAKPTAARTTHVVSDEVFKQVYDSPQSLPGRQRWLTSDKDVRTIEKRLGLDPGSIGAPLWVSGDTRNCKGCGRETNWLDIVDSALAKVHDRTVLVQVILGERKYVNTEVPSAIADLACSKCKLPIRDLRSFKCHNWAYARGKLAEVVQNLSARPARSAR